MSKHVRYEATLGNLTDKIRTDYLNQQILQGRMTIELANSQKVLSLIASDDQTDLIYFWQLYSVLGKDRIRGIVCAFYTKIFSDVEDAWFKEAFESTGSLEYHVNGQTRFWMDVMGGGAHYKGGERKLSLHHKLSKDVMTDLGAYRWMTHMNNTLKEEVPHFGIEKYRILSCLKAFLIFFMKKYSIEFDFNFITHDFDNMLNNKIEPKL